MKILYGCIYNREDFDQTIKLRGTRSRVARKGKEWFTLDSKMRVVQISQSKDDAIRAYGSSYGNGRERLHNIESVNAGRCSRAVCHEIFKAWQRRETYQDKE